MYLNVEVVFYSEQRQTLPRNGYRPDAVFGGHDEYWGITFFDLAVEHFNTWLLASMKFTFQECHYNEVFVNQTFRIMEGPRQVGEGRILSIEESFP